MGNYFSSNKVNANQHLINTDNKITILVDNTSIDVPVSQPDKANVVGGEADANVTEPEIVDVVEDKPEPGDEVVEPEVANVLEGGEVAEADVSSKSESSEVAEADVSSKSESSEVVGDLEQQGGDSESSVENTTRINKPKNRRKNKRSKN
jgi:hypothetical protein